MRVEFGAYFTLVRIVERSNGPHVHSYNFINTQRAAAFLDFSRLLELAVRLFMKKLYKICVERNKMS